MENDLIRRQDALEALGEEPPVWYDGEDEIAERNQWRRDVNAIKAVPSVQPKTGKWMPRCIDRKLMTTFVFECSNCGVHTYTRIPKFIDTMEYVYCPYCGAKMLKEGD